MVDIDKNPIWHYCLSSLSLSVSYFIFLKFDREGPKPSCHHCLLDGRIKDRALESYRYNDESAKKGKRGEASGLLFRI